MTWQEVQVEERDRNQANKKTLTRQRLPKQPKASKHRLKNTSSYKTISSFNQWLHWFQKHKKQQRM